MYSCCGARRVDLCNRTNVQRYALRSMPLCSKLKNFNNRRNPRLLLRTSTTWRTIERAIA